MATDLHTYIDAYKATIWSVYIRIYILCIHI